MFPTNTILVYHLLPPLWYVKVRHEKVAYLYLGVGDNIGEELW